ncbi:MAG: GNAT family N-acetyltransferase [Dehalococcoidales bacterium]|nr:MAG: GNAT family N-acetyltransferase [Dehalococcoidales bacterium]
MDVTLRKGTVDDAEELFILVQDFATSFLPDKLAFRNTLEQVITDESANLTVALLQENIVGYCLGFDHYAFYANGRVSWVEEIMVREDLRKTGIGRKLMDEFEDWCIQRSSQLIGLATRRAAPFYEALNYENSAVFFRKLLTEV